MRLSTCTLALLLLLLILPASGCATDDILDLVGIPLASVGGTWSYTIDNADGAFYRNCTGDAAVLLLEGKTFTEALTLGLGLPPICHVGGLFQVTQNVAALIAVPDPVTCSDGITIANVTGVAVVAADSLSGQWDYSSSTVDTTQGFQGSVNGNAIATTESSVSFSGTFQGSCDIVPPLIATVTVQ